MQRHCGEKRGSIDTAYEPRTDWHFEVSMKRACNDRRQGGIGSVTTPGGTVCSCACVHSTDVLKQCITRTSNSSSSSSSEAVSAQGRPPSPVVLRAVVARGGLYDAIRERVSGVRAADAGRGGGNHLVM